MTIDIVQMAKDAKKAAVVLGQTPTKVKNQALLAMADQIEAQSDAILAANQKDIEAGRQSGLTEAFIERLTLNEERVKGMANGLRKISRLEDPTNTSIRQYVSDDGLRISQKRVPLGVVGIIYESRPNVTADASALCLKAGNATILRGGSDALNSNVAIMTAIQAGLEEVGLDPKMVQMITDPSRDLSAQFMQQDKYIDCLIPRGGAGLINAVKKQASIPVIETGTGNCHLYVEASADLAMAVELAVNAKTQRPSTCNSIETLVVDEAIAADFLPRVAKELVAAGVELRGDAKTRSLIEAAEATDEDYATEYADLILAIKVVADTAEAIDHVSRYSTKHSEGIVTSDYLTAQAYTDAIDASTVYVNASTRFTDGEIFGLGGEIGISTQKLHARGPMGLEALTSYKYVVEGQGQVRQ